MVRIALPLSALVLVLLLFLSAGPAGLAAANPTTIAILRFDAVTPEAEEAFQGGMLAEIFTTKYSDFSFRTGKLKVVERNLVKRILDEQEFGDTGLSGTEAQKIGQLLGANAVLIGTVSQFMGKLRIDARLVNVTDGAIILAEGERASLDLDSIEEAVASIVLKMLRNLFPDEFAAVGMQPAPTPPPAPESGRLWVFTEPGDALVRIMNITPPYSNGMQLPPGAYHVNVTRPGYAPVDRWIDLHSGETKQISLHLVKERTALPHFPQWKKRTFRILKLEETGGVIYFHYDLGNNRGMDLNSRSATDATMREARMLLNKAYSSGEEITVYYVDKVSRSTGKPYELLMAIYSLSHDLVRIERKYAIP